MRAAILSLSVQLLGDYDKVKAVSEGSDCQCKCVVRPLGHEACKRVNAGASRKEDVYTVETITSGSSCKCACVAPPSALNPCEGDFRLQKLREADSRDLKVGPGGTMPWVRVPAGPLSKGPAPAFTQRVPFSPDVPGAGESQVRHLASGAGQPPWGQLPGPAA